MGSCVRCLVVFLVVTTQISAKSYFHPNLRSKKGRSAAIRRVLIMPPQVDARKTGWKGVEVLHEEGLKLAEVMRRVVENGLRDREFRFTPSPFSAGQTNADPERLYAMANLQQAYDRVFGVLAQRPEGVKAGRHSLGHEIGRWLYDSPADTLAFIRAAVHKDRREYRLRCWLGLVHVRTGDVLFYSEVESDGDLEGARKKLQQFLALEFRYLSAGGAE